jgi:hypothetical protein
MKIQCFDLVKLSDFVAEKIATKTRRLEDSKIQIEIEKHY